MSNAIVALIRTLVPLLVGAIVGWLANLGLNLDPETQAQAVLALSTLAASLYYIGVTALAKRVPAVGWLLGVAKRPVYSLEAAEAEYAPKHAA